MGHPVLHVYADYKWTGPSEPVALLCRALCERGWRADLACAAKDGWPEPSLGEHAAEMGLRVFDTFRLRGGLDLAAHRRDMLALRRLVREGGYRLVHCHGTWDHMIAKLALARPRPVPLVRSDHEVRLYRRWPLWRRFYGPVSLDHLVVLGQKAAVQAVERLRLPPSFVTPVRGAVDTEAFRPMSARPALRRELGLREDAVVFGVVARIQRHRRFEVLLEAAHIVQEAHAGVQIAVCGRGTHKRSLLDRPIEEMGLGQTVISLGYRRDDYREVLSTFDAGIMLVPGSDGSCRAALQMAALAKPLVVAERGVLPDIVEDGRTGIVVKDTPENLAAAMLEMARDADGRARMGAAARERMARLFTLDGQADAVVRVYEALL